MGLTLGEFQLFNSLRGKSTTLYTSLKCINNNNNNNNVSHGISLPPPLMIHLDVTFRALLSLFFYRLRRNAIRDDVLEERGNVTCDNKSLLR